MELIRRPPRRRLLGASVELLPGGVDISSFRAFSMSLQDPPKDYLDGSGEKWVTLGLRC
jgi:hypothetical protein